MDRSKKHDWNSFTFGAINHLIRPGSYKGTIIGYGEPMDGHVCLTIALNQSNGNVGNLAIEAELPYELNTKYLMDREVVFRLGEHFNEDTAARIIEAIHPADIPGGGFADVDVVDVINSVVDYSIGEVVGRIEFLRREMGAVPPDQRDGLRISEADLDGIIRSIKPVHAKV